MHKTKIHLCNRHWNQTIFHIWKINKNSFRHEIILYFYQYRTDFGFSDMLTSTAKSMDIW